MPAAGSHIVRLLIRAVVPGAVMLAACAAGARADTCPAAALQLVSYSGAGPFTTNATDYDTTFVDSWTAHVTFHRGTGDVSLSAASGGRMTAWVRLTERFDVTGVAPGTPVPATLVFVLDGWAEQSCGGSGCGVRFEATLAAGSDSVTTDANQAGPGNRRTYMAPTLLLPVTIVAGTPVEAHVVLYYGTGPGGGASAACTAHYGVTGLPAGVRAVPCVGGDVTPVRATTWGALKQIYR